MSSHGTGRKRWQGLWPYLQLMKSSIQSRMEYRGTFIAFLLTIAGFYLAQIAVIGLMLGHFGSIGGWTPGEMAFLYSLLILSTGFVSSIFSGMLDFSDMIRDGTYDRLLLRPLSTLGQVLAMRFDLTGLLHLFLGLVAIVLSTSLLNIEWTFLRIAFMILSLAGGVLILGGIRIIVAAICFFTVRNESLQHLIVFSTREFLMYPISIYVRPVQFFLTFLLPIAFVNFYPAHVILDRNSSMLISPVLAYLAFPAGLFVFTLALYFWKLGERHYSSTGS
jgi:ABC-2 type transport system permease protein